jgi:sec-independent protein translocase protein TatC
MDTPKPGDPSPSSSDLLSREHPTVEESGLVSTRGGGGNPPASIPPASSPKGDDEDDEYEDGAMLRMTFLEHLEEMRSRIISALYGFGVSFLLCIIFANQLWEIVSAPAFDALKKIGANPPVLVINEPMEGFSIIWVKVPLVISLFLASPWVLYQVWAFIAPGLYKNEKKWAVPFVVSTAGLFITGGCFAYFVAFRFGLAFLLGIGLTGRVIPLVTITNYFDLFTDVMLGVSAVFELPVIIFFLTLLHIASPSFLMAHSRYAILAIVIIAAIITPTPDVFNLMLFAVPMCMLFFVGVFASHLLVLHREGKKFPWLKLIGIAIVSLAVIAGISYWILLRLHYHPITHWPFFKK